MKTHLVGFFALASFVLLALTGLGQVPNQEKKGPGFDKKGPPPFVPGKVLPPFVREALELSEDQEMQIAELEKEVRAKLLKILTDDQVRRIGELKGKGPKGPPGDDKGFDKGKGKKKGPDGPPKDGESSVFDTVSLLFVQPCESKRNDAGCR